MSEQDLVKILETLADLRERLVRIETEVKGEHEKSNRINSRISKLEDDMDDMREWRVKFVAKFSTYSAIALSIGAFLSQMVLSFIGKVI